MTAAAEPVEPEGLSVAEYAELHGLSPAAVRKRVFRGTLHVARRSGRLGLRIVASPVSGPSYDHAWALTPQERREIRRLRAAGVSVTELMGRFDVCRATVYRTVEGLEPPPSEPVLFDRELPVVEELPPPNSVRMEIRSDHVFVTEIRGSRTRRVLQVTPGGSERAADTLGGLRVPLGQLERLTAALTTRGVIVEWGPPPPAPPPPPAAWEDVPEVVDLDDLL